jgi:membrane associated rhomboid family serine protease
LVAGFARLLGPIANSAHLSGLMMGTVWGYLSSLRYRKAPVWRYLVIAS